MATSKIICGNDGYGHIGKQFHSNNADWFVRYDFADNTTALVICGADGIGVLFLVLEGDRVEEFKQIADKYNGFNEDINGELGECIRFACSHKKLIAERCTIGGVFSSKLRMAEL